MNQLNLVNELVYEFYDNLVANKFLGLLDNNGLDVDHYSTNITFTKEEVLSRWLEMHRHSQIIEQHPLYKGRLHFELDATCTQELLNHLHQFVEEYEIFRLDGKMTPSDNQLIGPSIDKMNSLIHYFENNNLQQVGWVCFRIGDVSRSLFTEEEVALGQADQFKDKLYIGYGEVGKTMKLMYQNQDTDGIERQQTNPKQSVTTELFLPFGDILFNQNQYTDWCADNNIETGNYHFNDKRHWATWEVGTLVAGEFTMESFNRIELELA